MNWTETQPGYCHADAGTGDSEACIRELIVHVRDAAALHQASSSHDHLRLEIWSDSGRLILFPAMTGQMMRIDKVCGQIYFPGFLDDYEALADGDLGDEQFEAGVIELERQWAAAFLAVAGSVAPGSRFEVWSAGDERVA